MAEPPMDSSINTICMLSNKGDKEMPFMVAIRGVGLPCRVAAELLHLGKFES